MARLKGLVETVELGETLTLEEGLQKKINNTIKAMREAGAPESDIEQFRKESLTPVS
jgi:hypothetical protein